MAEHQPDRYIPAPLGHVEPHAGMLKAPCPGQLLYKMMTIENLLRSIEGSYLYFNRVDHYVDFPESDPNDGDQLPQDRDGNEAARFAKAPDFSAADYYARARSRTYACCFSMENSDHIWTHYANGCDKGKVCVVFQFGKLREILNQTVVPGRAAVLYNGTHCRQIFSLNYGIVEYVDWDVHQANAAHLPNPLSYTYLKGSAFSPEKELRISLSALGMGQFALNDGSLVEFPPGLQMELDFRASLATGAICQILRSLECDAAFLQMELGRYGIAPAPGSDPPSPYEKR
jgi:hypothetical protein